MKFQENVSNTEIVGEIQENKVGIDANNLDFIVSILSTNLYSDAIGSFLRETVSNAYDSHIEAGTDAPILLRLQKDEEGNYFCEIRDFGVGLSPERFDKIYRNIGSSTKRDSNEQIGGFGIGRFAALAYSESVNITSIYDGIKTEYLMYKDGNSIQISNIFSLPTDEINGVAVKVNIKNSFDLTLFIDSIFDQLSFFPNLHFECYNESAELRFNNQQIKDTKLYKTLKYIFTYNKLKRNFGILLGNVTYPTNVDFKNQVKIDEFLDSKDLDLESRIKYNYLHKHILHKLQNNLNVNLFLKFEIGEIAVVPNREQILLTPQTEHKIFTKFCEVIYEVYLKLSNKVVNTKTLSEYLRRANCNFDYSFVEQDIISSQTLTDEEQLKFILSNGEKIHTIYSCIEKINSKDVGTIFKYDNRIVNFSLFQYLSNNTIFFSKFLKPINLTNHSSIKLITENAGIRSSNNCVKSLKGSMFDTFTFFTERDGFKYVLFMEESRFKTLTAREKRYLTVTYPNMSIQLYNVDVFEQLKSNLSCEIITKFYKSYLIAIGVLKYQSFRHSLNDNKCLQIKKRPITIKEFENQLSFFLSKMEINFKKILKKADITNFKISKEFEKIEQQKKLDKLLNKTSVDTSSVINLNIAYSASFNYNIPTFSVENTRYDRIEELSKKGLFIYSTKDDDSIIEFSHFIDHKMYNSKRVIVAQVAKTKMKFLDELSKTNTNIINFNTMINNPQQFRYVRDLGTVYMIHKKYPKLIEILESKETLNSLRVLNPVVYEKLVELKNLLGSYNLNLHNMNNRTAIARQMYDICKSQKMFNFKMTGLIKEIEPNMEAIELLYNLLVVDFKIISSNSYLSYSSIVNSYISLGKTLAPLFIKSKMMRPNAKLVSPKLDQTY